MNSTPHILVVDDHFDIRDLVKRFLEKYGFTVSTAEDGKTMREVLSAEKIDLVVLDIMMPGESGLDICKSLRAQGNNVPIIMLTAMNDDADLIVGLEIGADDYMTKPFKPRELLARIKAILRRSQDLNNEPTQQLSTEITNYYFDNWSINIHSQEVKNPDNAVVTLTTAEYDLLMAFIENPQETLSRDFLLNKARGRTAQIFDRSIDTLISRLRKKINYSLNTSEYIKTVRGGGYYFTAEVTHD